VSGGPIAAALPTKLMFAKEMTSLATMKSDGETRSGSAENDVFAFSPHMGRAIIVNLQARPDSGDIIELHRPAFADVQAAFKAARQVGYDVIITADLDNPITLKNVMLTSLRMDDLRIAA
jgi:hypothetical protein